MVIDPVEPVTTHVDIVQSYGTVITVEVEFKAMTSPPPLNTVPSENSKALGKIEIWFVFPVANDQNCDPRKEIAPVGLVILVVKLDAVPVPTASVDAPPPVASVAHDKFPAPLVVNT